MRAAAVALRPSDPAFLLATWFGIGLLPKAPGTWGALAALPFAWGLAWLGGPVLVLTAALLVFVLGLWASARYSEALGIHDAAPIVIDEVAAQWLTLAFAPLEPLAYILGFLLFRVADMAKPWPANWIDRRVGGGLGIMADDVVAAIYAGGALMLLLPWFQP